MISLLNEVRRLAQDRGRRHEQIVYHGLHLLIVAPHLTEPTGFEECLEQRTFAVSDRQRVLALGPIMYRTSAIALALNQCRRAS